MEQIIFYIEQGGPIAIAIMVLGIICALAAVGKSIQLGCYTSRSEKKSIHEILRQLKTRRIDAAIEEAQAMRHPLRDAIITGIKYRTCAKAELEDLLYEELCRPLQNLERMTSVLAIGAGAAPLLGLLGTVNGMITTFSLISQHGSGDAQLLSEGISIALITTELGLMVAIPSLIANIYISRKIKRITSATQHDCLVFVNGLKLRTDEPPSSETEVLEAYETAC